MARKRRFSTFNLSFLDIMSCGFGAVALVFLIIDHATDRHAEQVNRAALSEVALLEEDLQREQQQLAELRNALSDTTRAMAEAQGRAEQLRESIAQQQREEAEGKESTLAREQRIATLKAELLELQRHRERLQAEGERERGDSARRFIGDGDRQYLTGLKLGGERVLILIDSSASMLDHSLVNVIRTRNLSDAQKRQAEKWQRAVRTVEWITAKLPQSSRYQIYHFNRETAPLLPQQRGVWSSTSDAKTLQQQISALRQRVPEGGTNLYNAFAAIDHFTSPPDNIFLITDGLPTQGSKAPSGNTVSGKQRLKLFNEAAERLTGRVPLNIILMPMEGDPLAASAFWKLAQATDGAFLTPSEDWP